MGLLTILPNGLPDMRKAMGLWALYLLLVAVFVAYITSNTLPPGADYLHVFRVAGAAAFMPLVLANLPAVSWEGMPWGTCVKFMIDGALYSLLVAGAFASMWP